MTRPVRLNFKYLWLVLILLTGSGLLTISISCKKEAQKTALKSDIRKLDVLATTSIVGDVVEQIAGANINLNALLPRGTDPHSFEFSPHDVVKVTRADLIFINGGGLEQFLDRLLDQAAVQRQVISVSQNIKPLDRPGETDLDEEQAGHEHEQEGIDPHFWFDPQNVASWVEVITTTLVQRDSLHAHDYRTNAKNYLQQLQELDQWINDQVALIPASNRKLVADHLQFGYFTRRYGFEQIGAIVPAFSALSEPSARDLAQLENVIRRWRVKAIFIGRSVRPELAERLAQDTGAKLFFLYTGSLNTPGQEADTYINYMKHNVAMIVQGLKD